MKKDTSWNSVAGWYDRHVSASSDHHRELVIPGAIRLLSPVKGEKILDIGCGEGVLCRELAKAGAIAFGVDASKKLIDIAKKKSGDKLNINYRIADASNLEGLADGTFDALTCVLAIQNMEDLDAVSKESARVLKKNGRLIWVMNHPCFRIPRQSGWGFDEKRKLQYRRIDKYMSEMKYPHPDASGSFAERTHLDFSQAAFSLHQRPCFQRAGGNRPGGVGVAKKKPSRRAFARGGFIQGGDTSFHGHISPENLILFLFDCKLCSDREVLYWKRELSLR